MKKEFLAGLAFAAVMLLLAVAAKFAHARGYIDGDTTLRVMAMNGLMIAYFGNLVPKKVAPNACARHAMRFSGWSLVLSGLIYAGLWAFAPIPLAVRLAPARWWRACLRRWAIASGWMRGRAPAREHNTDNACSCLQYTTCPLPQTLA